MEMRLATVDTVVKPSAPAMSEMMRKITAYLNIQVLPTETVRLLTARPCERSGALLFDAKKGPIGARKCVSDRPCRRC
jgi:hypothetical protein